MVVIGFKLSSFHSELGLFNNNFLLVQDQARIPTLDPSKPACFLNILLITTQQTASANGPQSPLIPASPSPSHRPGRATSPGPPPHLQQRQVRVQVREAVQDHRAAVLDHLQPHPVPNVPHPPRRVKHLDQLSRLDAVRLGLHPREIDHGCPRSRVSSHSDGGDILPAFIRVCTPESLCCCCLRCGGCVGSSLLSGAFRRIMTHRGFSRPRPQPALPSALWEISDPEEAPEGSHDTVYTQKTRLSMPYNRTSHSVINKTIMCFILIPAVNN